MMDQLLRDPLSPARAGGLQSCEDKKVTARTLPALCLRFRPDRIIVREVRVGEAFDLLQALNTGGDGYVE